MAGYVPPGWPSGVHPPGSEDFERTAQAWLLDTVPPDYRLHGVLRRYPLALAAMAAHHTKACVAGAREGYRTARTELGEALPPHALEAVLAAYRAEGRRLVATAQAVGLVARALRGEVFTPQLQEPAAPDARRGQPGPRAAHDRRRPGAGPGSEDRFSAGRTAPAEDQLSAGRATIGPGADGQPGSRRVATVPGSPADQAGVTRAAAAAATAGERSVTGSPVTGTGAGARAGARNSAAAPGQTWEQPGAQRTAAGTGAEGPEWTARDGAAKARKAPATQRPARNGGAARRKTRPSDKQAAAG
jgi:hypothetical protein